MTNRRAFITLIGGAAAACPLAARAQQSERLPTVGFLGAGSQTTADVWVSAFMSRLRELGWIEGRNIKIDVRWAEGTKAPMLRVPDKPSGSHSQSSRTGAACAVSRKGGTRRPRRDAPALAALTQK
jgi:hypothetical protein